MKRTVAVTDVLGRRIFTVLTEPDTPSDKLIIMSHGFKGTSTGPARTFVDFEALLLEDGFSCLRFDQPGSGNSEGDFLDSSFNVWVDTIAELADRHLEAGNRVALLGQSMGASATMIAAARPKLPERVPCILLWAPGANDNVEYPDESYLTLPFPDATYVEEDGQRVRADYWREAYNAGFFKSLDAYKGGIHLVYGENDRFDPSGRRARVITRVEAKGQPVMILPGQDHSSWDYDAAQEVFAEERAFLRRYFN